MTKFKAFKKLVKCQGHKVKYFVYEEVTKYSYEI
jgi:hypothetical protein